jgi:glycerophosphoryl diester phosphodiesterase
MAKVNKHGQGVIINIQSIGLIAIIFLFFLSCSSAKFVGEAVPNPTNLNDVLKKLHYPDQETVLISAHRGDWRNAPENSIQGLNNCIKMGIDIIEFDLNISKDGHLIVLHDNTLDRTTTGKGRPEDYNLAELKSLRLRDGASHFTSHTIPTLEEYLIAAKGKVVVCIDKGFLYFDQAMTIVNRLEMSNQIIYNIPNLTLDSLKSLNLKNYSEDLMLNLLGFSNDVNISEKIVQSYSLRKRAIMHPVFANDTVPFIKWMPKVKRMGLHLWLNALWPEHNGGHHDDRAVDLGEVEESWGWLIDNGATIIQTDRPEELKKYLMGKKLSL